MASKLFQPLYARLGACMTPDLATQIPRNNLSDLDIAQATTRRQFGTTPALQFGSQIIKPAKTQIISRNMTLKYSMSNPSPHFVSPQRSVSEFYFTEEVPAGEKKKRPLAVVMAWLMAGEKQLEKYRQLYLRRGYDVLTVRTSPLQFVFPETGSQKIAENMVQFLAKAAQNYPQVLVHAFSVGAYQFGELLVRLKSEISPAAELVKDRMKGIILDSAVDLANAPPAVGRALAPKSKAGQKAVEVALEGYLRMAEKMATRHYRTSQETLHENPFRIPSLIIVSHKDKFATLDANEKLAEHYSRAGIPVELKVFTESPHVQHYRYYPTEYEQLMERFLNTVQLTQEE